MNGDTTEGQAHASHLVIHIVLVDVVLVKDELQKLPHCVHVHRLQFPGFAACLLIVTERHVAGRKNTTTNSFFRFTVLVSYQILLINLFIKFE